MDPPENSNVTDKSWDHPWTTDEMRQHCDDWSLAADAGLLKHLQQFSDNLTERFMKTQERLKSLNGELEEASVIIDNVTNTSLALANTQFIESRVHEDDVEMEQPRDAGEAETQKEDSYRDDLIACVGESIRQGLNVMDEKFQRVEVLASDSEDEGEIPIPSVVLKPNDPYQNRPLPYVIGTDKWNASSKVGLDSSSSDSEAPDVDEDSPSEGKHEIRQSATIPNNRRESLLRASLSSSSSELSGRNERPNTTKDYSSISQTTDKLQARSQDTLNSGSEIATPSVLESRTDNSSRGAPSFAEELAKRLGNVLPSDRSIREGQEADQSSINRFKDDLLAPDDNDVFDSKSENLFSESNNLFDDDVSNSLWKNEPYRPPMSNIIPPSFDVPPPMHTEATKPKSAFDDLCGDPESDDPDNIFAPKSMAKSAPPKSRSTSDDKRESGDSKENKFLNVAHEENAANMATSTPEINDNGGLFGDENDYEDDDVLFGNSVKSRSRTTDRSPELSRATNRPTPPALSITQADILSSNLGSRLFQRVPRQASTDSSDIEASMPNPDPRGNERIVAESDSSGISMRPNNNTTGNTTNTTFGLGADFQPESESTRLKSEEIYRERYPSDSLYEGRTRQPLSAENSSLGPNDARNVIGSLDLGRDEDFDVDDVFGPPPLPKHNDSKSKSNDDLFSTSSSESRSHKSFDLLSVASESQYDVKISSERDNGGGGLFDEDVDIFGSSDVPQIDIFGEAFRSTTTNFASRDPSERPSAKVQTDSGLAVSARINENPRSSFPISGRELPPVRSAPSIFDDSEEDDSDDLFTKNFRKSDRPAGKTMLDNGDDDIFAIKPSAATTVLTETKKDLVSMLARETVAHETASARENDAEGLARSDKTPSIEKTLPNYSSSGLFDNLDEHDVDDVGLFASDTSRGALTRTNLKKSLDKEDDACEEFTNESDIVADSDARKSGSVEKDSAATSCEETPERLTLRKDDMGTVTSLLDDEKQLDVTTTDGAKISKVRDPSNVSVENTKRDPPRTLSIRLPTCDDTLQAPPRRAAVSSKIKKLQGKMGDLKILSPTDTPPMWRKSEEKSDSEADRTESRDTEDGGFVSVPSTKSPTTSNNKVEDAETLPEVTREPAPGSPLEDSTNSEVAVSFDLPAQVEVLAVTASKSRARIQAKRRPQSRRARQSALRKSGIDFDTVDNVSTEALDSDPSDSTFSGISDKLRTIVIDTAESWDSSNRLDGRDVEVVKRSNERIVEASNSSLAPEDRSELSTSKGSISLSLNKHTLLSPSTDEEDLFDVPPDLPEDPPREDTLFGRAPILSPIDRSHASKKIAKLAEDRQSSSSLARDENISEKSSRMEKRSEETTTTTTKTTTATATVTEEEPMDPLRDNNHDPLKDPSQLFAFVTKTPSPEKGQNVLFKENASLFTHLAKNTSKESPSSSKKPVLDLFADDTGNDLFTDSLIKSSKKSVRAAKNESLFDDVDSTEEDFASDLFASRDKAGREKSDESMASKKNADYEDLIVDTPKKRIPSEPENLSNSTESRAPTGSAEAVTEATRIRDIFGDQSSGEEDLFAKSRVIGSGKNVGATGSLFSANSDDEDADDIFGTRASTRKTRDPDVTENRSSVKKAVTRDLKKTAEKIVQDPLSMLQDE